MNRFNDPFRQSILNEYLSYCGMKVMFKYIYGEAPSFRSPKAIFGIAIHRAISNLHKVGLPIMKDYSDILKDGLHYAEHLSEGSEIPVKWPDWEEKIELIQNFLEDGGTILRNYCKNPRNRECELVLNEAEGTMLIADKYDATFRIDQLRHYPDGSYELLDLKYSDMPVPSDARMRRSVQLIMYAMGIRDGEIDGLGNLDILPNRIGIYNLKDHLEYQKPATPITPPEQLNENKTSSYVEWLENEAELCSLEEAKRLTNNNRLRAVNKVYVLQGHQKGPGIHTVPLTEHRVKVIGKKIQHACGAIRMNIFPMDSTKCDSCSFRETCDAYLDGLDKPKEFSSYQLKKAEEEFAELI